MYISLFIPTKAYFQPRMVDAVNYQRGAKGEGEEGCSGAFRKGNGATQTKGSRVGTFYSNLTYITRRNEKFHTRREKNEFIFVPRGFPVPSLLAFGDGGFIPDPPFPGALERLLREAGLQYFDLSANE
jgi:hypothetical protein